MKLNPLPDFLNTKFTIIEIGLFYAGVRILGSKNMQIPDLFWQELFKMVIFGRYLITWDDDVWQHFKYWLSSSNVLLKHWTYFPKDMLIDLKQLLNLFCDLISAFDKFQWLLRYLLLRIIFALIFKSSIN